MTPIPRRPPPACRPEGEKRARGEARGSDDQRARADRGALGAALLGFAGALLLALVVAGCGGGSGSGSPAAPAGGSTGSPSSGGGTLIVLGASSLTEAVTKYGESFAGATVKASFAGSDELAAQIRQGAKADVFASADTEFPRELFAEGLVERPRVFARNALVIAVPEGSEVKSLADLAEPGVKLVIGDPSVPVGAYTRTVLGRLPAAERAAIMANVVSEETAVASIVAKLQQGAADAGFVYVTDEANAEGLEPVRLDPRLQPDVAYGVAVVRSSGEERAAREFVAGLVAGEGQEDLREAGFLPPP